MLSTGGWKTGKKEECGEFYIQLRIRILSFGVDKPMDIFRGWDNYVERLEENWQAVVRPEDTVVVAGDISWGIDLEEAKLDFAFLHRLNGTKIIQKGNHDLWFSTKTKGGSLSGGKWF